jgi:hypothetical protein
MARETEVLGENCPGATLSTTDPTWPYPGLNPGRRDGKPTTNRFSYGAAVPQFPRALKMEKNWFPLRNNWWKCPNFKHTFFVSNVKISVFCDVTTCSQLKVNLRFGGTCHLHLQDLKMGRTRHQREPGWISTVCTLRNHRCEILKFCMFMWLPPLLRVGGGCEPRLHKAPAACQVTRFQYGDPHMENYLSENERFWFLCI